MIRILIGGVGRKEGVGLNDYGILVFETDGSITKMTRSRALQRLLINLMEVPRLSIAVCLTSLAQMNSLNTINRNIPRRQSVGHVHILEFAAAVCRPIVLARSGGCKSKCILR